MFPSFPTSPHPQAPACPGASRRQEQGRERVMNDRPKYEGESKIHVLKSGSAFPKAKVF